MAVKISENKVKKLEECKVAFLNIIDVLDDIKSGVSETKACWNHGISIRAFRHLLSTGKLGFFLPQEEIPSFPIGDEFLKKDYCMVLSDCLLSWQEKMWIELTGKRDPCLIPYDIEETIDYLMREKAPDFLSERQIDLIYKRYQEGKNDTQVAKEWGVSRTTVDTEKRKTLRKFHDPHIMRVMLLGLEWEMRYMDIRKQKYQSKYSDYIHQMKETLEKSIHDMDIERIKIIREECTKLLTNDFHMEQVRLDNMYTTCTDIKEMHLSSRACNALRRLSILKDGEYIDYIKTVGDILEKIKNSNDLMRLRNIGVNTAKEIIDNMREHGYPQFCSDFEKIYESKGGKLYGRY